MYSGPPLPPLSVTVSNWLTPHPPLSAIVSIWQTPSTLCQQFHHLADSNSFFWLCLVFYRPSLVQAIGIGSPPPPFVNDCQHLFDLPSHFVSNFQNMVDTPSTICQPFNKLADFNSLLALFSIFPDPLWKAIIKKVP